METIRFTDKRFDLEAILGVHSRGIGVTFGGIRLLPFERVAEAERDALRLSEAMTHKLSMIGEPFGGSKMVVRAKDHSDRTALMHRVGELVDSLKGFFITAIDFGFAPQDAIRIREKTRFILGFDGPGSVGASGTTTALGAFGAMPEIMEEVSASPKIAGKTFAIQGLGSVGGKLAELILDSGGLVSASDPDESKLQRFRGIGGFTAVDTIDILSLRVNVLCPCGPACVINPDTIPDIKADVIAGVANCVLEDELLDDRLLMRRGILFAPDFVLNAGGVMQGISEHRGRGLKDAIDRLPVIQKNLRMVFRKAKEERIGTMAAAKAIAADRRGAMERCNGHRKDQIQPARR